MNRPGPPAIQQLQLFRSTSTDPYYNLALEQRLMEAVPEDCCTLYLWQNQHTVVIGRNQNAWRECRTALLKEEGGALARRLSGGGAVYHDLGNLNFTFLMPSRHFDLDRQLEVIARACAQAGIQVQRSGRNDLLAGGRKFSGSAFYRAGGKSYHHGTLMVRVDKERLNRYLSPSAAKLEAKGVPSVQARVANLADYAPDLTCQDMDGLLEASFAEVYGLPVRPAPAPEKASAESLRQRNASWEWVYGSRLPFSFQCERRFPWGEVQLQLNVERGRVSEARVYSDAMDWLLPSRLERALTGVPFVFEALCRSLEGELSDLPQMCQDLCLMLKEQEIG